MVKQILLQIIIFLIFISLFSLMCGCTPAIMDKVEIQQVELELVPYFEPPIEIKKPEKPSPVFLDGDFNQTDISEKIEYFAFNGDEFVKIIQLSQAFDVQENLLYLYLGIINKEIDVNNDLKEMLNRKDAISQHFADLYINEQNLRLQENHQHEKSKILDRIFLFIESSIILVLSL